MKSERKEGSIKMTEGPGRVPHFIISVSNPAVYGRYNAATVNLQVIYAFPFLDVRKVFHLRLTIR
jgi:hypothetical protein